ncbi:unnamed protein product [Cuscuta campestris]|uniref:Uncharacterized protein n=1 Tax=Cuscuta campestris TaxID=132261 RepID=A0A484MND0_9ASTE|nr:unnamed protein product [Cuscuta campestris]
MGATLYSDQHPSIRLQRSLFYPSSISLWLPHHLPHQEGKKRNKRSILYFGKASMIQPCSEAMESLLDPYGDLFEEPCNIPPIGQGSEHGGDGSGGDSGSGEDGESSLLALLRFSNTTIERGDGPFRRKISAVTQPNTMVVLHPP